MSGKRVILVGATGMVGGLALRRCLVNPDVSTITVVGRRVTGLSHAKLREVLNDDFTDYADIGEVFDGQNAALFCIGAYTGAVADE